MTRPVVRWAPAGVSGRRQAVAAAPRAENLGVIDAVPPQLDLHLYAGDDFHLEVTVTDSTGALVDLTGSVPTAQIRQNTQDDPPLASLVVTVAVNVLSLHLLGTDAAGLPPTCVWDCQVELPEVVTLLRGNITVTSDVTRPEAQLVQQVGEGER